MNDKNTAGIDLDNVKNLPRPDLRHHGEYRRGYSAAISDVIDLARRAEPSVTAADERALFQQEVLRLDIIDDQGPWAGAKSPDGWYYFDGEVDACWKTWQARAALASPAVSQKDGAAVDVQLAILSLPITRDFDGRAMLDRASVECLLMGWPLVATPAATTASACKVCNGMRCVYGVIGDPPEECEACADQQPAEATTASASEREALQFIHDAFKRDLDQGYKTRDKEFAVSIAAAALARAPLPAQEPLCPACQGSGEGLTMEGAGPDAYEVPCNCPYCNGSGELLDAYNGVVAMLAAEHEKYMRCCGKVFAASLAAPAQAGDARDSARYRAVRILLNRRDLDYYALEGSSGDEIDQWVDAAMSASQGKTQEAK